MVIRFVSSGEALRQTVSDTICISMTPTQSRMARAALGWSLDQAASAAGIQRITAARFETGKSGPGAAASIAALRAAYEAAGIILIEAGKPSPAAGVGVRVAS